MRGEILNYDDTIGSGLISGDDGVRYTFARSSLAQLRPLRPGMRVDFVPVDGTATEIMVIAAGGAGGLSVDGVDWKNLFLSFEGRTRRSHFWIAWLILLGVGVVTGWIPLLGILLSLALIWPNLAIAVKRLHDMGRSGWLALAPIGISIICLFAGFAVLGAGALAAGTANAYDEAAGFAMMAAMGPAMLLFAVAALIGLAFLLWIGLTDSQPGENRFGPNPKGQ